MGLLAPLLEIQDIDRECDRLSTRRRDLSERAARAKILERIAVVDVAHAGIVERRAELDRAEHSIADQVGTVAARAKGIEDRLYGGTVTAAKDLSALQGEIATVRVQQGELEAQELTLLEEMDEAETEMAENRSARAVIEVELRDVEKAIEAAEGEIDAEIAEFGRGKASHSQGLPSNVLDVYEGLRAHQNLNGVAAAAFTEKGCGGCRMSLPRLQVSRMRAEPEDALLHCENCGRMLVR